MNFKQIRNFSIMALASTMIAGCLSSKGDTKEEKQAFVNSIEQQSIQQLISEVPEAQAELDSAAGYAVFSNLKAKIIWGGAGRGYGVAVNKNTGERTYMKMAELQAGVGFGISDFRAVFVFQDENNFNNFLKYGIDFSVRANLEAAQDGSGSGTSYDSNNIQADPKIYNFTDSGIALTATLNGTKYWKSIELN